METTQKTREQAEKKAARPVKKRPQQAAPKTGKKPEKAAPKKKQSPKKPRPDVEQEDISTKKRAYGNSKPKKRSALTRVAENTRQTIRKKRKKRTGTTKPQIAVPAVIYTEPKAFNSRRLLLQMLTVTAVVVAFVLALSVFFKVEKITVTGADVYSVDKIEEASGLSKGSDNLLTFSRARSAALIKANLPYVNTVRFGIKLPDTVNIIVDEAEVVYSIKDSNGQWWLMNSDGRVVEMTGGGAAANYTQVLGVTLESPAPNLQVVAAEASPTETDASGEFIPVTVTGAQRLNIAMQILKALEANDIVGEAASVDVTRVEDIILWYGTRYQVNLGDSTRLDYKIAYMNDAILEELQDYQSGILDVSFTIRHNEAVFTPFG